MNSKREVASDNAVYIHRQVILQMFSDFEFTIILNLGPLIVCLLQRHILISYPAVFEFMHLFSSNYIWREVTFKMPLWLWVVEKLNKITELQ